MNYKALMRDSHIQSLLASERHTNVNCVTHFHSNMEIILVTEGTLNIKIGKDEYIIPKGFGVFVSPFESHSFTSVKQNKCHILMFVKESAPRFYDFLEIHTTQNKIFSFCDECLALVDRFLPHTDNHADFFKAQAVLSPLVYSIYSSCDFKPCKAFHDDIFIRILEYMNEHFTEPITLESAAKFAGLHPVTLSKMFTRKTNTHFNEHLNYLRCSYAVTLLKNGSFTCIEAAYAAGFGSLRTFNRAFVNIYNTTPKAFKASSQNK